MLRVDLQKGINMVFWGLLLMIKDISFNKATNGHNPEGRPCELPPYVSFTMVYSLVLADSQLVQL